MSTSRFKICYRILCRSNAGTYEHFLLIKYLADGATTYRRHWQGILNNDDSISLPWDSANNTLGSGASTRWTVIIPCDPKYMSNGVPTTKSKAKYVKVIYDRTNNAMSIQGCDASGNTGASSELAINDVLYDATSMDVSIFEYSQSGYVGYASLNQVDDQINLAKEFIDTDGCTPVIDSATLTDADEVTVGWSADASDYGRNPSIAIQYSTDDNFATYQTENVGSSSLSGSTAISGLSSNSVYYFRVVAVWTDGGNTEYSNATLVSETSGGVETQTSLANPSITNVNNTDDVNGSGTLSWSAVDGAAGYQYQVSSDGTTWGAASSSGINGTTLTYTNLGDKYVRVMALAASNDIYHSNSGWSIPRQIPVIEIDYNTTRMDFYAIPSIHVDYHQIYMDEDVITKGYGDAHYARIGDAITPSTLPFAEYGVTDADSSVTVISPAYLESRIGALDLVYAITDIKIASNNNTNFGGVATAVASEVNESYTLVTKKAVYDFASNATNLTSGTVDNARLNKANGTGSSNAGIVYVTDGSKGLTVSNGAISVRFQTSYGTNDSSTSLAATPSYVGGAISNALNGYIPNTEKVSTGGTSSQNGKVPILDTDGKLSSTFLPTLAITDTFEANSKAAMLALSSAEKGDICIRTDINKTYILSADGYDTESHWKELKTPTDLVISVAGLNGAITATDLKGALGIGVTDIVAVTDGSTSTNFSGLVTATGTDTYTLWTGAKIQETITNLNLGTASTYDVGSVTSENGGLVTGGSVYSFVTGYSVPASQLPIATWTAGTSNWNDSDSGTTTIVSKNYLALAIADYDADKVWTSSDISDMVGATNAVTDFADNAKQGRAASVGAIKAYVNNYVGTLGTAAAKDFTTSVTSGSSNLVTSGAVYTAINNAINGLGAAATYGVGSVASGNGGLVTGGAVYTAINNAISGLGDAANKDYTATVAQNDTDLITSGGVYNFVVGATYAIDTYTSGAGGQGKIIKTKSSGATAGKIDANFVPIDDYSLIVTNGLLGIDFQNLEYYITDFGYATESYVNTQIGNFALNKSILTVNYAGLVNPNQTYSPGEILYYQGNYYRCHTGYTTGAVPGANDLQTYWTRLTLNNFSRYAGTITGDGSATEFNVTHSLGAKDVDVTVIDNDTDKEVYTAILFVSSSVVKIGFGAAPANGKVYRVVVRR